MKVNSLYTLLSIDVNVSSSTPQCEKQQKKLVCQKWDSNPRLQSRLRPERSALDRSAILTCYLLKEQYRTA